MTAGFLWILIAFTWEPFTATVERSQAVDKTKQLVYNVYNNLKEKVKKDE
tara:strand:+ start:535 stop:684 length:150 start_codon:yes stop_codon:yes gene_type:complete